MDGGQHLTGRLVLTLLPAARAVVVAPVLAVFLLGGPVIMGGFEDAPDPEGGGGTSAPVVDASSADGSVAVRIEVAGSTVEGESTGCG